MLADPDRGLFFLHGQDETVAAEAAAKRKSRMRSMAARRMTPWPVPAWTHWGAPGQAESHGNRPAPSSQAPLTAPLSEALK